MGKVFLIALSVILLKWQNPPMIVGKWIVDDVDVSAMKQKMTSQQKEQMKNFFIKPLTNAVFEFKPDHHFYLSANLGNMPKDDYWEYDDANKLVTIKEYSDSRSLIMKITVLTNDGITYFTMQGSPVILKVHKL